MTRSSRKETRFEGHAGHDIFVIVTPDRLLRIPASYTGKISSQPIGVSPLVSGSPSVDARSAEGEQGDVVVVTDTRIPFAGILEHVFEGAESRPDHGHKVQLHPESLRATRSEAPSVWARLEADRIILSPSSVMESVLFNFDANHVVRISTCHQANFLLWVTNRPGKTAGTVGTLPHDTRA